MSALLVVVYEVWVRDLKHPVGNKPINVCFPHAVHLVLQGYAVEADVQAISEEEELICELCMAHVQARDDMYFALGKEGEE